MCLTAKPTQILLQLCQAHSSYIYRTIKSMYYKNVLVVICFTKEPMAFYAISESASPLPMHIITATILSN